MATYASKIRTPIKLGGNYSNSYSQVEEDGTIRRVGDATAWDDWTVPMLSSKRGANDKPDYDYDNLGLLFPQNSDAEYILATFQMQHAKKMDSDIYFHVHYIQDESDIPVFKIEYKWYNNGGAVPGSWTTISTADGAGPVATYSSGTILQILPFAAISPPSSETVSSNIDVKFYRDDNVVAGDVLTKYIDFHFEKDTDGSRQEYSK